jgi:phosphatidylglycerol:prolipoprotein diacylglycerol transferase
LAFSWTGFSLTGAILGLAALPLIAFRAKSLVLLDIASPGLAVGIALAKVGCWMAECCYGAATEVPWAVKAPACATPKVLDLGFASIATPEVLVHPAQLYAIASAVAALVIALLSLRAGLRPGSAFLITVGWIEALRFVEFSFRTPDENALIWPAAISLTVAGIALLTLPFLPHKGEPS